MTMEAYIGLGANLGDGVETFCVCLEALDRFDDIGLVSVSSLYQSAAVDYLDQPDFVNAAARLETTLPANDLLRRLQSLETRFGRQRPFPKAPRTLDLDLLLYGEQTIVTETLIVPHPEMTRRAFVLMPLLELDGDLSLPDGRALRDCLRDCQDQRIERFDDPRWRWFSPNHHRVRVS